MRVHLIVVGRDRKDPLVVAADEYGRRLRHPLSFQLSEVKEVPARKGLSPDAIMKAEAERVQERLASGSRWVALERTGSPLSSVEVAERLETTLSLGVSEWAFVIGGPYGLDPAFVGACHERWSLSPLTLPHRMARLVLLEQLYRAQTIVRGEPYHK